MDRQRAGGERQQAGTALTYAKRELGDGSSKLNSSYTNKLY